MNTLDYVKVTAADFNGYTFDGSPFSKFPDWLEKAILNREITLKPADTDYAQFNVKTNSGILVASAGDLIVLNNDQTLNVKRYIE